MSVNNRGRIVSHLRLVAIALVLGIFVGDRLGPLLDSREPSFFYQTIIKGRVGVTSAAFDGTCPSWPNDNFRLDDPIVTDGKTWGFALGSTDLYESDLSPDDTDGLCYYYREFDVLLSTTGVYELSFPHLGETANSRISFRAEPKHFWGFDTRTVEAHSVWWYLTTINCPEGIDLCLRDDDLPS